MSAAHHHSRTAAVPSVPVDSLDAGPGGAFGRQAQGPRSSLDGSHRPVLLKQEAQGESGHVVKPRSDALPTAECGGEGQRTGSENAVLPGAAPRSHPQSHRQPDPRRQGDAQNHRLIPCNQPPRSPGTWMVTVARRDTPPRASRTT